MFDEMFDHCNDAREAEEKRNRIKKCNQVIQSCKTLDHIETAKNYLWLFENRSGASRRLRNFFNKKRLLIEDEAVVNLMIHIMNIMENNNVETI